MTEKTEEKHSINFFISVKFGNKSYFVWNYDTFLCVSFRSETALFHLVPHHPSLTPLYPYHHLYYNIYFFWPAKSIWVFSIEEGRRIGRGENVTKVTKEGLKEVWGCYWGFFCVGKEDRAMGKEGCPRCSFLIYTLSLKHYCNNYPSNLMKISPKTFFVTPRCK